MSMIRQMMRAQIRALGDDEVEVRVSTEGVARDGHILIAQGGQLDNYRRNPVVLWNHDVDLPPVARSEEIAVQANEIVSRARFAPMGISPRADEIRGLVKAGFINGVSLGFDPIDAEPLDPKKPRGGMRCTNWELLEWSFCCVPIDTEALVIGRALSDRDLKSDASRELPIEDTDVLMSSQEARDSIFAWAGGDDFDPKRARKAFLLHDAAHPKERSAYEIPIAHVVDGRLKTSKAAIRAAGSVLTLSDIPDVVRSSARAVLDHYEEKAGMAAKDGERTAKTKQARALRTPTGANIVKRGLCEVANLAYLLESYGWAHGCAEWEAEIEGDESPVPAMMGEALVKMGEAFLAMTKEEVAELLAGKDLEMDDEAIVIEERAFVAAGKTAAARAWRFGIAKARAGKSLSTSNEKKLGDAVEAHGRALKHQKAVGEHHGALKGHMDAITANQEKAQSAHDTMGEALGDAKKEPDKAAEHLGRCMRAHKAAGAALGAMAENSTAMADTHADANDSNEAVGRHLKAAQRCVRAVVDGAAPDGKDDDEDSEDIQKSGGDSEDEGARAYKQRQADLARLSTAA